MHFGISPEAAGVSLNIFLGSMIPLITYKISKEVTQREDVSICAAILAAVNPTIVDFSHELQRDMLYLFFIGFVIWFLLAGIRQKKNSYWFYAGIFCSFAFLSRFETAEFFLIIPCALIYLYLIKTIPTKDTMYYGIACFTGFAVTTLCLVVIMQIPVTLLARYHSFYRFKATVVEQQFHPEETGLIK